MLLWNTSNAVYNVQLLASIEYHPLSWVDSNYILPRQRSLPKMAGTVLHPRYTNCLFFAFKTLFAHYCLPTFF